MTIFSVVCALPHAAYRRVACALALACMSCSTLANEPAAESPAAVSKRIMEEQAPVSSAKEMGNKVREALGVSQVPNKRLTLVINGKAVATAAPEKSGAAGAPTGVAWRGVAWRGVAWRGGAWRGSGVAPQASRKYLQARAAVAGVPIEPAKMGTPSTSGSAHGGDTHWTYEGEMGPQSWGKLKPEFNLCALGKRQSPINIEEGATLVGPAEPVQFNYVPSNATVVNNGHTIQVDVQGENAITVRGSSFKLLQFHFHTPSEEQINFKRTAMVAHLVHKNDEGQLAVVAVLLEPGTPNPLIEKVWTYMPLDAGDRVRMPRELLNMNELLPADQRYYQFMGSLTTPPCSEGVLWLVLKKPMQISQGQYKLFTQLYPNNARPVQPVNGRPVRDAQ